MPLGQYSRLAPCQCSWLRELLARSSARSSSLWRVGLMRPRFAESACPPGHEHAPVQGANAKRSGRGLAEALASRFASAILPCSRKGDPSQKQGLERLAFNDVLLTARWQTRRSWPWRSQEANYSLMCWGPRLLCPSTMPVYQTLALEGDDARLCLIFDLSVARGALAKGRSSARQLAPDLRRAAALQIAGGLYPGFVGGPTRFNVMVIFPEFCPASMVRLAQELAG